MSEKIIQEKCGLVAVYSKEHGHQLNIAILAAVGVQHRGTHGAGTVLKTKRGLVQHIGKGLLREVFTKKVVKKIRQKSKWLIIHTRYGTHGGYLKENLQPCICKSPKGEKIVVAHNGQFIQMEKFLGEIPKKIPKKVSDTYIFTELLAHAKGNTWNEKILNTLDKVTGAYALLIGVGDSLYAARDPHGVRPLSIGSLRNKRIIASETHAFDKIGAKVHRELKPGEVVKIGPSGVEVIRRGSKLAKHFCDFEWAYFSRPDSLLPPNGEGDRPNEWLSVNHFREGCGEALAKEFPVKNATFVVGIPDSGLSMATGYASALGLRYRQAIVRDHFDPEGDQRLFMRDDQIKRIQKKVLGKLSLVPEPRIWKDSIVVIGDDSIVRGNVSAEITKAIFMMGAREVHWIIGFPPVMKPCHLGVSIRSEEELIAARHKGKISGIIREIRATSVHYISNEGFIKARLRNLPFKTSENPQELFLKNGGCGGCVTGNYPISKEGIYYKDKTE